MLPAGDQDPGHQQATSSVLCTTSCKHSLVLLRMSEIITGNMLSWFKILITLLLLHLVGCLCYFINDTRSHKHQILFKVSNTLCSITLCVMLHYNDEAYKFFDPCNWSLKFRKFVLQIFILEKEGLKRVRYPMKLLKWARALDV